jgi:integrase
MQGTASLISPNEMAYALEINSYTLCALVHSGTIPHTYVQGHGSHEPVLRFNPYTVTEWLQSTPELNPLQGKNYIDSLRLQYKTRFPGALQSLKTLDSQFAPKRIPKGYNLAKVPNQKYGFLYYVRYIKNGKLVPSRWNTHTNNYEAAEKFAIENKERILAAYYAKRTQKKANIYAVLKSYYDVNSSYLADDKQRGRTLNEKTRSVYYNFITKVFIPFLKSQNIADFDDATAPVFSKLQTALLAKGNKPQTVNRYFNTVSAIFDHLIMDGTITENVFDKVIPLKETQKTSKKRGCYEIGKINGIFNRKWREELDYLLCLVIYSTGLRNSEIEKIQAQDLISMKGYHFINIQKSKTENGVRIVPLHDFVYKKLLAYIKKHDFKDEQYLFSAKGGPNQSKVYKAANALLGKKLKMSADELEDQHITFYSGRHHWKTLMNANELGDVEEYFMGHKVSRDIAKRYNHRDKQGQKMIIKKAREVFAILDRWVFKA